jgi:hypothetical protein
LGCLRGSVGAATLAASMETLNTPNEIALWISASSAYTGTRTYPNADSAAQFADSMVLELRKRKIEFLSTPADLNEQLRLAAERGQCVRVTLAGDCGYAEGHVTWRPDFSTDTIPAKVGTHWCGANEPEDSYRVISVEILDA